MVLIHSDNSAALVELCDILVHDINRTIPGAISRDRFDVQEVIPPSEGFHRQFDLIVKDQ